MEYVVDSNYLQSTKLRDFLGQSTNNIAIINDYAAMEAYKGDTLKSIFPSMEILSEYPEQVVVLKGTQAICGLRGRRAGLKRRLIDSDQTAQFKEFCHHLSKARSGNRFYQEQLLELGKIAQDHMDRILADAAVMTEAFDLTAKVFDEDELKVIRKGGAYSENMINKMMDFVFILYRKLHRAHPKCQGEPRMDEALNCFLFRASLSAYILFLRWASVGGPKDIKPENMRNDMVDSLFAAYATYFDGLLTDDRKMKDVYDETSLVLDLLSRRH